MTRNVRGVFPCPPPPPSPPLYFSNALVLCRHTTLNACKGQGMQEAKKFKKKKEKKSYWIMAGDFKLTSRSPENTRMWISCPSFCSLPVGLNDVGWGSKGLPGLWFRQGNRGLGIGQRGLDPGGQWPHGEPAHRGPPAWSASDLLTELHFFLDQMINLHLPTGRSTNGLKYVPFYFPPASDEGFNWQSPSERLWPVEISLWSEKQ